MITDPQSDKTPVLGMLDELLAYDGDGAVRLTRWEVDFIDDVQKQLDSGKYSAPSSGQAEKIFEIWGQVFG